MSLNVNFLRAFPLDEEAVSRILAAHQQELDTLTAERDAAREAAADHEMTLAERDSAREESARHAADAEQLRTEMERFRQEVHEERTSAGRRSALNAALREAGANELAIPLLSQAIATTEDDWDGVTLRDAAATLSPLRQQYGAFFSAPVPIPTVRVTPPLAPTRPLTQADLRTMSATDINRHWPQVRQALRLPD